MRAAVPILMLAVTVPACASAAPPAVTDQSGKLVPAPAPAQSPTAERAATPRMDATGEAPTGSCGDSESERAWYEYLHANFRNVFPDGNRNFGGAKWFAFCEQQLCPDAESCDRERMRCCTNSYCPYSGALRGGAAEPYGQILLSYCLDEQSSVSICCSPCICHLQPKLRAAMTVSAYKGMDRVLFEDGRPIAALAPCDASRTPFGRKLDDSKFRSCTRDSHDPMRSAR